MNSGIKQLATKLLIIFTVLSSQLVNADGNFGTTQLINLNLTLNHSESGLLTGEQAFQVSFSAQRISDNSDISFNPGTGELDSHATISSVFTNGVGNIEIPILLNDSHQTLSLHTLKNVKVKIALNNSPTDFIEIPFSSSLYSIQSMTSEQLSGSTVLVDRENDLVRIKKIKLIDDNYEINTKTDLVSVGDGLSINQTNQVSITGPTGTPAANPFLKYNTDTGSVEWAIIEGVEEASYQAERGIQLDTDTFRIATNNVTGTLATGHIFAWDEVSNQPKWSALVNIPIGDEIKLASEAGDEGKIRYNAGTNNFEGFTGTEWEILNSANVSVTIDNSDALWAKDEGSNNIKFANTNFKLGLGTNDPGTNRLEVNGNTEITGTTVIGNTLTAHSLILQNASINNTADTFVTLDTDRTIKKRGLSTLVDRGLVVDSNVIKLTNENATTNDIFRYDGTDPEWVPLAGTNGVVINHASTNVSIGLTTNGGVTNDDVLGIVGGVPSWQTIPSLLNGETLTGLTINTLTSSLIKASNTSTTNTGGIIVIETDTGIAKDALQIFSKTGATSTRNITVTKTGQLFTGGLSSIDQFDGNTFNYANKGYGYSQHFVSATYSVGSDVFTTASVTDPTLEARKLAQPESDPIVKVYESGTPDTIYFSVNADKTLKLFKHSSAPTDGCDDNAEDGNLILTDSYILCVCKRGGTDNFVKVTDGTTSCF